VPSSTDMMRQIHEALQATELEAQPGRAGGTVLEGHSDAEILRSPQMNSAWFSAPWCWQTPG
jgi:hypothetical protein